MSGGRGVNEPCCHECADMGCSTCRPDGVDVFAAAQRLREIGAAAFPLLEAQDPLSVAQCETFLRGLLRDYPELGRKTVANILGDPQP